MSHLLYRLIPPRPTFDRDMSEAEAATMGPTFEVCAMPGAMVGRP